MDLCWSIVSLLLVYPFLQNLHATEAQGISPTPIVLSGKIFTNYSVHWTEPVNSCMFMFLLYLLVAFLFLVFSGKTLKSLKAGGRVLPKNGGMVTSWTISTYLPERDKGNVGIKHFK